MFAVFQSFIELFHTHVLYQIYSFFKRKKIDISFNLIIKLYQGLDMSIKLKLTSESILAEKFPSSPRGYDALKVDQYLDEIIQDYKLVESNHLLSEKEINLLNDKIKSLEGQIKKIEIENKKYEKRLSGIAENMNASMDNADLLKRLSTLETFLFKNGFDPSKIK